MSEVTGAQAWMAPKLTGPASERKPSEQKQNMNSETKPAQPHKAEDPYVYRVELVWRNVLTFLFVHLGTLYGTYLAFTGQVMIKTIIFSLIYGYMSAAGITGGAHRLWSHKAYKARWPMRVFLSYWQAAAYQNHIYEWVRDHRVHHKYCDTTADPHNSKRGFFFCHMGWLMVKKHRDVIEKGKTIDMSDIEKDWVVMFQKKHYAWLMPLSCFIVPITIPCILWGESAWMSFWYAGISRWTVTLNLTWLVNSAAHMWGDKPYDREMTAVQNTPVAFFSLGEGWHNYHHTFPWDYKASELKNLNVTTHLINLFALLGLAYDLKEASPESIKERIERASKEAPKENPHEGDVWGWDDKDMTKDERNLVTIKLKTDKSK